LERRWHPSQKNQKLKDGSLELASDVAGTKGIKAWIMGFGSLAKVLEPASLVEEIKVDLGRALRLEVCRGSCGAFEVAISIERLEVR